MDQTYKNLIERKSRAYGTILYIYNLWKIYANVNIDSSSHSFLGHNLYPQAMGFMHTFRLSFFPFK